MIVICTDALCPAVIVRVAGLAAIVRLETDGLVVVPGDVTLVVLLLE
jgi:hypothetical protein